MQHKRQVEAKNFQEAMNELVEWAALNMIQGPWQVRRWVEETSLTRVIEGERLSQRELMHGFHHPTKDDMAKFYGLTNYDCTLPQGWLNEMAKKLFESHGDRLRPEPYWYDKVLSGTVWSYHTPDIAGEPFYLLQELKEICNELERV